MNQQQDLTQGNILNNLIKIAAPIVGTQLMQMLYNLTDIFWLGRVSSDAVAAAGTGGMYMWLASGIMVIGYFGATIGVSQSLGRGDRESAQQYSKNSLFVALICGIICTVIMMVFKNQLVGFFNIKEANVVADATSYLAIVAVGITFTFISSSVSGTFNAAGNSRTPFYISVIGLAMNIVLDPLLIMTLDLGVIGAALATTMSQMLAGVLSIAVMFSKKTRPLGEYSANIKLDKMKIKQIFRWSIPISCETLLFCSLSMVVSRFVSAYGADAISTMKVGAQIESLSWLIAQGVATALTAFIGQNYGAKKISRIIEGSRISTIGMIIWGIIVTFTLYYLGGELFYFILPDPEVTKLGVEYLKVLSICQISGMLEGVGSGIFRGMGKTMPSSVISITVNISRVVLSIILSQTSMGFSGIWWGMSIGAIVRGVGIFLWAYLEIKKLKNSEKLSME